MNIEFISRHEMKKRLKNNLIDKNNTVVISVNDTTFESMEMMNLLLDYCNLGKSYREFFMTSIFADDEKDFDENNAGNILSFINHHGTKKDYLIQCFAGISRSGAIAKFINEYYDAGNWYLEDYKGYNRHVFNMLHKAAGTSLAAYYEELEKAERTHGWED